MQLYLKTLHGGSGSSSIRGKQLARERMKEKGEISEEEEVEHVMMTIILSLLSLSLSISGWAQTSVKCLCGGGQAKDCAGGKRAQKY
jgi:hypothetical protein